MLSLKLKMEKYSESVLEILHILKKERLIKTMILKYITMNMIRKSDLVKMK